MLLLGLGFLLEFAIYIRPFWSIRKYLAGLAVILIGFSTGALLVSKFDVFTSLMSLVSIYRVINLLRIVQGRMHEQYLRHATMRTSLVLASISLALLASALLLPVYVIDSRALLIGAAGAQFIAGIIILLITIRTVVKTKSGNVSNNIADKDLPSVTVAIPARNESDDLISCLQSVMANEYPKLEVLVLDDCSDDKTSEIIRGFAQKGVRFIRGEPPRENWLAKNQAYARLAKEATGEYLLFCGVDVRMDSLTIRQIVSTALARNKRMISVMPKRYDSGMGIGLVQPMRYWWEIALSRRLFNRPAVLSTCWLIEKKAIRQAGGFKAVSRTILPEAYFAKMMIKEDAYGFLRADNLLPLQTVKKFDRQLQTALRTRYPQLHKRPENVLALTVSEVFLLLGPFLLALSLIWVPFSIWHILSIAAGLLLISVHGLIITVTNPANWWLALLNLPAVILADLVITHISMWQYEFSIVEWKGRDVSIPVMHAIPRLPQIETGRR